jgi:hypothetical protein
MCSKIYRNPAVRERPRGLGQYFLFGVAAGNAGWNKQLDIAGARKRSGFCRGDSNGTLRENSPGR